MDGLALYLASEVINTCKEERGVMYNIISRQADPTDDAALIRNIASKLTGIVGDEKVAWLSVSWGNDVPQSARISPMGSWAKHIGPKLRANLLNYYSKSRISLVEPHLGVEVADTDFILNNWSIEADEPLLIKILCISIFEYDELEDIDKAGAAMSLSGLPPPPRAARSIDQILAEARTKIIRLSPADAFLAFDSGISDSHTPFSVLIDIRPEAQRRSEGSIPGAIVIERNVLEWRLDPASDSRLQVPVGIAERYDNQIIVFCSEGYTSSLAAASLLELGLGRATDIIGGFKAWAEQGYPTT